MTWSDHRMPILLPSASVNLVTAQMSSKSGSVLFGKVKGVDNQWRSSVVEWVTMIVEWSFGRAPVFWIHAAQSLPIESLSIVTASTATSVRATPGGGDE